MPSTDRAASPSTSRRVVAPAPAPLSVRTLVIAGLILLAVIGLAWALSTVANTVLLLLVAIVFAEGIRPLVARAERFHLPRVAAILVVYVGLLAVLAAIVVLLVQPVVTEAQNLVASFPSYQHGISDTVRRVEASLHLTVDLASEITNSLNTAKDVLLTVSGYVISAIVNFMIILLLGFLWLTSSDHLKAFVVDLFPNSRQELAADVMREMGLRMGGFLRATAFNMVAVGVLTGAAAGLLGLPSPILLGMFAGLAGAVPLVGPFVGAVPAVLLGFTVSPLYPLIVAAVIVGIQLVDANLIVPQVMNRVVALPALAVVLGLLIGAAIAGIAGALLAIPLTAACHVLVIRVLVPSIHAAQGRPA